MWRQAFDNLGAYIPITWGNMDEWYSRIDFIMNLSNYQYISANYMYIHFICIQSLIVDWMKYVQLPGAQRYIPIPRTNVMALK